MQIAARGRFRRHWLVIATVTLATVASVLTVATRSAHASLPVPTVTSLSVHSGGTWGGDGVTIRGTAFAGTGSRAVVAVRFGRSLTRDMYVVNDTTVRAVSPEVRNRRATVDVQVVLQDGTRSTISAADRFTYVVPTMYTRLNGGWSAAQSRAVARSMIGRTARLDAAPVAHYPGYWTPAMGRAAVRRAAGWIGMPYTWAGGSYHGPTYGACYGDGLIGKFDCKFQGFDCSGLTLYAWGRYRHLAHYAATQRRQAGRFHPTLNELQPGDLMFFSGGGRTISHVVMYAGGGRIIQAAESGYPVRYDAVTDILAWEPRYFGSTRPTSLGKQGSSPTITSISSATSPTGGGAVITIRGSHLDTAASVSFGSSRTYAVRVRSSTAVTVTVPAHDAGRVSVRLGNAWGVSPLTAAATMTYVAPPQIVSVAPYGVDTAGGTSVTITGSSFVGGVKVFVDGTAVAAQVLSADSIALTMPAHVVGRVAVTVTTPFGTSNRGHVRYVDPPPPPRGSA